MATLLGATDWSSMETMNCEDASEYLERNIIEATDIVAPVETKKVRNKPENQWLTLGIKTSLAHAAKLYHKYRSSKKVIDKMAYKDYNKILKKVNRLARNKYFGARLDDADNDTRKVWSILNEIVDRKQCKHRIPNRFIINGCSGRNKKNIANAFNNYFASIGKDMADSLPDVPGYEDHLEGLKFHTMWLRPLEEEEVGEIMKKQQPKMSCGIDTINNKIVKTCHKELMKPMTLVINKSN